MVRLEVLGQLKNAVSSTGIEPATFGLQHSASLNCTTACLRYLSVTKGIYQLVIYSENSKTLRNERNINIVFKSYWPPLRPNDQSSWLQIQRPGFDSRRYQIFWGVVGLERSPRSLVSTIEELLGINNSGSDLKIWEHGRRDPLRWPRDIPLSAKVGINFAEKRRSLGIVRSRTKATEFVCLFTFVLLTIDEK
jgi:hypothetical protein